MNHSYRSAAKIIGNIFRSMVRRIAGGLGMRHQAGAGGKPLTDDDVLAIWEEVERRRGNVSARPLVDDRGEETADTSTQVRETIRTEQEARTETALVSGRNDYYWGNGQESTARPPHFSGSQGRAFFKFSDESRPVCNQDKPKGDATDRDVADDKRDLRARINAMALRKLDVDIAVRESELAAMKRARAVLARDLERNGTAVRCGDEAQGDT